MRSTPRIGGRKGAIVIVPIVQAIAPGPMLKSPAMTWAGYALCAVKGAVAWFLLMLMNRYLVAMVVGGLAHPMRQFQAKHEFIAAQVVKGRRGLNIAAAIGVVLIAAYLWALVVIWNLGVALGAAMLILASVPDQIVEVRTGQKVSAPAPWGPVAAGLSWLALPILIVSLC